MSMYPKVSDVEHFYYTSCNFGPDIIAHMGATIPAVPHGLPNGCGGVVDPHSLSPHTPTKRLKHIGGMGSLSPSGNDDETEEAIGMNHHSGSTSGFYGKSPSHMTCAPQPPQPSAGWPPNHDGNLDQGRLNLPSTFSCFNCGMIEGWVCSGKCAGIGEAFAVAGENFAAT